MRVAKVSRVRLRASANREGVAGSAGSLKTSKLNPPTKITFVHLPARVHRQRLPPAAMLRFQSAARGVEAEGRLQASELSPTVWS